MTGPHGGLGRTGDLPPVLWPLGPAGGEDFQGFPTGVPACKSFQSDGRSEAEMQDRACPSQVWSAEVFLGLLCVEAQLGKSSR